MTRRLAIGGVCMFLAGATGAQETTSAAPAQPKERAAAQAGLERCFLVPAVIDMRVMSDEHVYVRTRGGNHYVLTVAQDCKNLQRSDIRNAIRLVNYGRRVCQNDGSYFLYDSGTRRATCPILTIDAVADRAEARLIAAGNRIPVDVEVVTLPD
jgi:hypothetical protein